MDTIQLTINIITFFYGIVIGSFLNVCIYRIPKKENIVNVSSHCMSCGHKLQWYELVPLFSFLFLRGKCRKCKAKISVQYPLIEAANGILYVLIVILNGINIDTLLYCLLASALLTLSMIDIKTFEIPLGMNIFILTLGLIRVFFHLGEWADHVIGFFCVSMFLYLLIFFTKGKAIGGGDMKLMAASGLFLGWKGIILAFLLACILGSVVHLLRMLITKCNHVLAMGPYLSIGIFIAMLFQDKFITWYLTLFI